MFGRLVKGRGDNIPMWAATTLFIVICIITPFLFIGWLIVWPFRRLIDWLIYQME